VEEQGNLWVWRWPWDRGGQVPARDLNLPYQHRLGGQEGRARGRGRRYRTPVQLVVVFGDLTGGGQASSHSQLAAPPYLLLRHGMTMSRLYSLQARAGHGGHWNMAVTARNATAHRAVGRALAPIANGTMCRRAPVADA